MRYRRWPVKSAKCCRHEYVFHVAPHVVRCLDCLEAMPV